jgi:hypothetical protein
MWTNFLGNTSLQVEQRRLVEPTAQTAAAIFFSGHQRHTLRAAATRYLWGFQESLFRTEGAAEIFSGRHPIVLRAETPLLFGFFIVHGSLILKRY